MIRYTDEGKLRIDNAISVEGRDDADAVSKACDAMIITTHGAGIRQETWKVIEKAYRETGIIILTDPDHAGEEIRRRLTDRFPEAIQCWMAREDAVLGDDIGVENANAAAIQSALIRAAELHEAADGAAPQDVVRTGDREVTAEDLSQLGLSGTEGAMKRRAAVCDKLGIGYCNSGMLIKRLRGFHIGYEELRRTDALVNGDK